MSLPVSAPVHAVSVPGPRAAASPCDRRGDGAPGPAADHSSPIRSGTGGRPVTAPNQWARYLTYRGIAAMLQVIPRPVASGLASAAGFTISELWRDKRPLVRANLRRVLGPAVDEATVVRLVTKAFSSYAHYWVESARIVTLRSDQIESTFSIEGFERFRVEMARGRGVVIALPHVGSWEYGGRWLAQQGYPMTTVGELLEPPELFDWFTSQRASARAHRVATRARHDRPAPGHAAGGPRRRTVGGPRPCRQRRRGGALR